MIPLCELLHIPKSSVVSLSLREKFNLFIAGRVKSYTLSQECLDAIEIKHDYQNGIITEEEYKAWCLKWNLTHQ